MPFVSYLSHLFLLFFPCPYFWIVYVLFYLHYWLFSISLLFVSCIVALNYFSLYKIILNRKHKNHKTLLLFPPLFSLHFIKHFTSIFSIFKWLLHFQKKPKNWKKVFDSHAHNHNFWNWFLSADPRLHLVLLPGNSPLTLLVEQVRW